MSYNLSPLFQGPQFADDGLFLVGGKLNWYLAGTTTPVTTYKDSGGVAQHTNPIILNSRGTVPYPVWLASGQSYKAVLTDADDVVIQTIDNIVGINDTGTATANNEWISDGIGAPTYIDATHFSVAGDQRSTFQRYRRVRATVSGNYLYGVIDSAPSYSAGVTTVTVAFDSGVLTSGLTAVAVGILAAQNQSIPAIVIGDKIFNDDVSILGNVTSNIEINSVGNGDSYAVLSIESDDTQSPVFRLIRQTASDWGMFTDNTDNFYIGRYDSSGVLTDTPFEIQYSDGAILLNKDVVAAEDITFDGIGVAASQSLGANGYKKLPGGLIIQWGTATVSDGSGGAPVTFPTSFAASCYAVIAVNALNLYASVAVTAKSTTGCTIKGHFESTSNPIPNSNTFYYLAIGQ